MAPSVPSSRCMVSFEHIDYWTSSDKTGLVKLRSRERMELLQERNMTEDSGRSSAYIVICLEYFCLGDIKHVEGVIAKCLPQTVNAIAICSSNVGPHNAE